MSFLEVLDRAAGATKSGGTTRRAAKMVCLDMDHPEIVDFINWKVREEKKAHALIAGRLLVRLQRRRLPHGQRAELEQLGPRHRRLHGRGARPAARGRPRAHDRRGRRHATARKDLWRQVAEAAWALRRPGRAVRHDDQPLAHLPEHRADQRVEPVLRVHVPRRLGLQPVEPEPHQVPPRGRLVRRRRLPPRGARLLRRAGDPRRLLVVPHAARSRKNSHDYRPLGLGYANLGHAADAPGHPLRLGRGARDGRRRSRRSCAGTRTRSRPRWPAPRAPFAGFAKNREPMLRVMGMHRDAAYAIDRDKLPRGRSGAPPAPTGTTPCGSAQRARLPQRAGDGARADRHHRPPDGLRHHRHRARLRAGEVQEARRRRLLQDRQPVGARGAPPARLRRAEVQEIVAFVSGTNTLLAAPHVNRATLKAARASPTTTSPRSRRRSPASSISTSRSARGSSATRPTIGSASPRRARARPASRCSATSASPPREIEEANETIVGRMTVEGAPHLRDEHYAVFDCANRCGKKGKRYLAPMSHVRDDGGGAAVPLRRDLEDGQPAERGDGRRRAEDLRGGLAARPQGGRALPRRLQGVAAALVVERREGEGRSERGGEAGRGSSRERSTTPPPRSPPRRAARPSGSASGCRRSARGFTQEARVGGHKIYLRTGEYEDGTLGEIFIDMHKEGAAFRSMMNCFAMAVSRRASSTACRSRRSSSSSRSRGSSRRASVEGHDNVKIATSIVDYLFRVLGIEYLQRYDLAHVPPVDVADAGPDGVDARRRQPPSTRRRRRARRARATRAKRHASALDAQLEDMMGDAPVCDGCGHITVRNGACYKCLNCGNSMGCS